MKYIKFLIVPIIGIIILAAMPNSADLSKNSPVVLDTNEIEDTLQLVKNNCLICHGAGDSHESMIAPPMHAVKNHYWKEGMSKESFVEDIVKWVKNPHEDNVHMYGAVQKFNIMPKIVVEEIHLNAIAGYIYDNDIARPNWCGSNEEASDGSIVAKGCNNNKKGANSKGCCSGENSKGCSSKNNKGCGSKKAAKGSNKATNAKGCNHGSKSKGCKSK